jgi:XTP/dITP diphosphohydrolase
MKPHEEFYNCLLNKINNFNKEEMIFIGDELEKDIKGGLENGIDTCWFNIEKRNAENQYTPKYEINSLTELKKYYRRRFTMDEIVFVTHNKGKIAAAKDYLKDVNFRIFEYELDEPRSDDIRYISKVKVEQAYKLVNQPCISLDCGFYIDELNGFPRAFVNHALETIGIKGILKLMDGKENRKYSFRECLSYYDGKEIHQFMGYEEGLITEEILGNGTDKKWSDLWYIYLKD